MASLTGLPTSPNSLSPSHEPNDVVNTPSTELSENGNPLEARIVLRPSKLTGNLSLPSDDEPVVGGLGDNGMSIHGFNGASHDHSGSAPGEAHIIPEPAENDHHIQHSKSPGLLDLPVEILYEIFRPLPLIDALDIPRVCSRLRTTFKDNRWFYRLVYLNHLDSPKTFPLDWKSEIRDIARLERSCRRRGTTRELNLDFVYNVINRLLINASPSADPISPAHTCAFSYNINLLDNLLRLDPQIETFFYKSALFERANNVYNPPDTIAISEASNDTLITRQMSAKLHCLYGKPMFNIGSGKRRCARTYPYACSKVYDMRQYTTHNRFGPFHNDGSNFIDWEKVEAIFIIIWYHLYLPFRPSTIRNIWGSPFAGTWPGSFTIPPQIGPFDPSSLDARDPYGVSGRWCRVICYMRFVDFTMFNARQDRLENPRAPSDPLYAGDTSYIYFMRLRVTAIDPPGEGDGQALPVVTFSGCLEVDEDEDEEDLHVPNSEVNFEGTVRLTKENEVRWTTISVPDGDTDSDSGSDTGSDDGSENENETGQDPPAWCSEGVQIGGVGSARGVLGNWFRRYPRNRIQRVGPLAFWKVSENATPEWPGPVNVAAMTIYGEPISSDTGSDSNSSSDNDNDSDDDDNNNENNDDENSNSNSDEEAVQSGSDEEVTQVARNVDEEPEVAENAEAPGDDGWDGDQHSGETREESDVAGANETQTQTQTQTQEQGQDREARRDEKLGGEYADVGEEGDDEAEDD